MSKIIIHNNTNGRLVDISCMRRVEEVMRAGFVSGENQYCWITKFKDGSIVYARETTKSGTHSFKVYFE